MSESPLAATPEGDSDMFTFVRYFGGAIVVAGLLAMPFLHSTATLDAGQASVIVQLKGDPAAVYRAKTQKSGGTVSDQQLQAYRDQLKASQDQFLTSLKSRGVNFTVDSVDIKGFDGATAATVQYRYTMVLNGIGMTLPKTSLTILKSMPEVKNISPNPQYHVALSK